MTRVTHDTCVPRDTCCRRTRSCCPGCCCCSTRHIKPSLCSTKTSSNPTSGAARQPQQSQSIASPQKCKNILPPSLHNFPSLAGTRSLSLKFWRTEAWTTDDWKEFDVNVPILKTIVSKLYIPFKYKSNICFEYGKLSIIM